MSLFNSSSSFAAAAPPAAAQRPGSLALVSLWDGAGCFPMWDGHIPVDLRTGGSARDAPCRRCRWWARGAKAAVLGAQRGWGITGTHGQQVPEQEGASAGSPRATGAAGACAELAWPKQMPESQSLIDSRSTKRHWGGKSIFLVAWRSV